MAAVATRLGALRDEVVFVGGAVLAFLLDDPGGTIVRATDDVDVVVDVATRLAFDATSARLRKLGFQSDPSEDAPLCRWLIDGVIVDVMPTSVTILGFTNRWYADAMNQTFTREVAPGISVRIASAPYFVAMKLEAFAGRGGGDFMASHDLEDVIAIVDGRAALVDEIERSSPALRDYFAQQCSALLDDEDFVAAIPGHLAGDDASQARVPLVLARLHRLARR